MLKKWDDYFRSILPIFKAGNVFVNGQFHKQNITCTYNQKTYQARRVIICGALGNYLAFWYNVFDEIYPRVPNSSLRSTRSRPSSRATSPSSRARSTPSWTTPRITGGKLSTRSVKRVSFLQTMSKKKTLWVFKILNGKNVKIIYAWEH